MNPADFTVFGPDPQALLKRLCAGVDDAMLTHIANCDYGYQSSENLAALHLIRSTATVAVPLRWVPREVLELTRWTEPDATERAGRAGELTGTRGHWARAFCCAALMLSEADSGSRAQSLGYGSTLIQLIESLRKVEADLTSETAAFLAWFVPEAWDEDGDVDRTLALVALLWTALHLSPPVADDDLVRLTECISAEEQRVIRAWLRGADPTDTRWLTPPWWSELREDKWRALGEDMAALARTDPAPSNSLVAGRSDELRIWLELIGSVLASIGGRARGE